MNDLLYVEWYVRHLSFIYFETVKQKQKITFIEL